MDMRKTMKKKSIMNRPTTLADQFVANGSLLIIVGLIVTIGFIIFFNAFGLGLGMGIMSIGVAVFVCGLCAEKKIPKELTVIVVNEADGTVNQIIPSTLADCDADLFAACIYHVPDFNKHSTEELKAIREDGVYFSEGGKYLCILHLGIDGRYN